VRLLAISGSYHRGGAIDRLIDRAIEGARSVDPGLELDRIRLIDKRIEYCTNCETCKKDDPLKPFARCVIEDDMQAIYPLIDRADAYLFGTPVNCGHETAVMKTFLERFCWVFARPSPRWIPLKGCPEPRPSRKKKAAIIVSSGIVPPILRIFCDRATALIRGICGCVLNARVVGSFYAGRVQLRGVEPYLDKAYRLGRALAE
jgi:multimeric flavodoxin WrbA